MNIISGPLVRYVLMAALRDKLLLSLILLIVVGTSLSVFLGSSALVESAQFSLVFAASGLRFAGAIGLVLFIVFYIRRSFDQKDVEFLLARPISRTAFILSMSGAFTVLAIALALAISIAIIILSGGHVEAGHVLWVFSLMMEYTIVVHAALFFSMVISSASGAALAVMGLYTLGRLMGEFLGDAQHSAGMALSQFSSPLMSGIAMFVPRIDLFAQTTWLVYPNGTANVGYGFIIMQGIIYSGLLACAALIDLRRRQF